jgi:phage terminase small subunit
MAENERGLNPRQAQFVVEYLIDLNATAAAKRAGYSENTAQAIGAENLTKPLIKAAIDEGLKTRVQHAKITKEWLERETLIAMADAKKDHHHPAVKGFLELMAKLNGHITEKRVIRMIRSLEDLEEEELAALAASEQAKHSEKGIH